MRRLRVKRPAADAWWALDGSDARLQRGRSRNSLAVRVTTRFDPVTEPVVDGVGECQVDSRDLERQLALGAGRALEERGHILNPVQVLLHVVHGAEPANSVATLERSWIDVNVEAQWACKAIVCRAAD